MACSLYTAQTTCTNKHYQQHNSLLANSLWTEVSIWLDRIHTQLNTPACLKAERVRDYKASWTRFRGDILKAPPKQHLPSDSPLFTVSVVLASAFMLRPWDYHIRLRDLINRLPPRSWRAGSSHAAALLHFSFLINLSVMFFFLPFFTPNLHRNLYRTPVLCFDDVSNFLCHYGAEIASCIVHVFFHGVCTTGWSIDVQILQLVLHKTSSMIELSSILPTQRPIMSWIWSFLC